MAVDKKTAAAAPTQSAPAKPPRKSPRAPIEPRRASALFYDIRQASRELDQRRLALANDLLVEAQFFVEQPRVAEALTRLAKTWKRYDREKNKARRNFFTEHNAAKSSREATRITERFINKGVRRFDAAWVALDEALGALAVLLGDHGWQTDSPQIERVHHAFNSSFGTPVDDDESTQWRPWGKARRMARSMAKTLDIPT